jgi:alpha-galactosidase
MRGKGWDELINEEKGLRVAVEEKITVDSENRACVFAWAAGADFLQDAVALEIASWAYEELFDKAGFDAGERADFADNAGILVQAGGWQSWSAGWELGYNETLPRRVMALPELILLTNREGDRELRGGGGKDGDRHRGQKGPGGVRHARGELAGHFVMYLRVGETYLGIASKDRASAVLPPVSFRIDRKKRRISAEVFCPGKAWKAGEAIAEICVFAAHGYFGFKDRIAALYQQDFGSLDFLRPQKTGVSADEKRGGLGGGRGKRGILGGYESWYNHYTGINEKIILDDLASLPKTDNILKTSFIDKGKPLVFQIDDGWEKAVGEWEIDAQKFPNGLRALADRIEGAGFVPGLWLAPFIVTKKTRVFSERPQWLLRRRNNGSNGPVARSGSADLVVAGFNHLWDGQYYCLDLSREDVLDYIKSLIDRAIDEWGFRYLKIDFLYAGLFSGDFANGGSPYEHYERACSVIASRTCSAAPTKPVAYLGCGAPLGPSCRHFPLSRIGADTREEWEWTLVKLLGHVGRPSAYISLKDTIGRSFMDNAIYCSDPDVVFLRTKNCKLSENEKETIALVNFLLAGQIMFSDDPADLTDADIAFSRRISALYEALADDEYGAVRIAKDVYRLTSRSGNIAGIINLSNKPYRAKPSGEGELSGEFLLDRRIRGAFAPHTISLFQLPQLHAILPIRQCEPKGGNRLIDN